MTDGYETNYESDPCELSYSHYKEPLPLSIFLLLIFIIGTISISELAGYNYVVNSLGVICAAIFLLGSIRQGFFLPIELKLFMTFCIWSMLGFAVARMPLLVSERLITMFQLFIMAWIVCFYSRNVRCISWLFSAVLIGVLIISVSAVITGDFARAEIEGEKARLAGLALNANAFGIAIIYGIAMALYFFRVFKSKIIKISIIGCILLSIRFIIASGSRKSIIGVALLILLWFVFTYIKELRSRPVLVLVMLIGMVGLGFYIAYQMRDTVLLKRLSRLESDVEKQGTRVTMIKEGIALIASNPILGVGLDNFRMYSKTGLYSHNNYIEIFSTTGIPGGIVYYMIYILIFRRFYKIKKFPVSRKELNVIIILKSMMLVLLFLEIGAVSYPQKRTWIVLAITFGYLHYLQKKYENLMYDEISDNCEIIQDSESCTN